MFLIYKNYQIIRHFYSEEWKINFLSYMVYPKNKFIRFGLFVTHLFSRTAFYSMDVAATLYSVDKFDDNYYLLTRDGLTYIAYITKDRLEVKNITNIIKIRKRNIINNQKHFVYDNKMFSIYVLTSADKLDNKKIFASYIRFSLKIILFAFLALFLFFAIMLLPLIIHFAF